MRQIEHSKQKMTIQKICDAVHNFEGISFKARAKQILVGREEYHQLKKEFAQTDMGLSQPNQKGFSLFGIPVEKLDKDTYFEVTGIQ